MKSQHIKVILFVVLVTILFFSTDAQCAMCQASAQNSKYANKLNTGILYLLFAPVLVLGSVLVFWIKNRDKFSSTADKYNA